MKAAATRILIVDDDETIRVYLRDLLEQMGTIDVFEAVDGPSGLALAREVQPDLVLLDLMMPGMSGIEVCSRLRSTPELADVPVIVLSAATEMEFLIAAIDAGAEDFLPKPIVSAELRAKVRTLARLNRVRVLAAERRRLRWLLDRSVEAMVVVRPDGQLVYANDRADRMLGLKAGEGVHVPTVLSESFLADPPDAWTSLARVDPLDGQRFTLHRPETPRVSACWLEVEVCVPEEATDDTVLLKIDDATNRVRSGLEMWTFQHLVSHKLLTPLNGLGPVLALVEESVTRPLDPEVAELLQLAKESALRLEDAVTGVMRYHQAVQPGGAFSGSQASASLGEIVIGAAASARFKGGIRWTDGAEVRVRQVERLSVICTELLENYAKFSDAPTAGLVLSATIDVAGQLVFAWAAPGPDLPRDVIVQLGRPFAQLERTLTGEVPGMGLGLATVRLLLRWIGGDLTFSSARSAVGSGLAARITLPLSTLS
jgi:DNA-binding response OmpR family regulator